MIEDDDPGESPIHVNEIVISSDAKDVLAPDIELFVDQLRFMGVDRHLVEEANRRLREDHLSGMRWLKERLKELEPPREPPTCQCGAALVDVAWRGRATVRCTSCGSRWGVEVIDDETEAYWPISGPSEEWREAHPVEEYDPYGDFQPEDVLRDGLPPLPATGIEPGAYFPVASWQGAGHAAVLYVHRRPPDEFDLPGDEYEDEIEHLVLEQEGEWMSTGSGGGNWVNVFDPPIDLLEKYVVLGTGVSGSGDGADAFAFTGGLCSQTVTAVETIDRHGTQTYPIDATRPFFVVGVHGPGKVRVLGEDGGVLHGPTGIPLEFRLND